MGDEEVVQERSERSRVQRNTVRGVLGWYRGLPDWGRRVALGGAIATVAVLVLGTADAVATIGRVHPGVAASDVPLGWLTPEQARMRLADEAAKRMPEPVTLRSVQRTWTVTGTQLGAAADAGETVDRAMAVGRAGGLFGATGARVRALFGGVHVTPRIDLDPAKAEVMFAEIEGVVGRPARDASIAVEGTDLRLVSSKPGVRLARKHLTDALADALLADAREIAIRVEPVPVRIADADARQALSDARALIAGSVTIVFEGRSWTIDVPTLLRWLRFSARPASPATGSVASLPASAGASGETSADASGETSSAQESGRMVLDAGFSPEQVALTLEPLTRGLGRPAHNAQFVAAEGRVTIKPGQIGIGPDIPTLVADLRRTLLSGGPRRVTLRMTRIEPAITTEKAQSMGISERISAFTTSFSSANRPRVGNIHLIGDALNNKLMPPGGVFSFNRTVGQRTAEKGYQEAPAIVDGRLVPQLGGGICQVGTTFFNTVFFSGLPVLERRNHSFYISHYPRGRDCTVSWGGPDFRFKNDTGHWILIRTSYTNSSITIALYGTDPNYDVEYTTSEFSGVKPHPIKEVKDPTLPRGVRLVSEPGADGANVTVVRTVYKGGAVVRTDTFVSHYKAKEEVVRVGTKTPSVPTTGVPHP